MTKPKPNRLMRERLTALGLSLPDADLDGIAAVVRELETGAEAISGPRAFDNEPAAAFRLRPAKKD